MRACICLDLGDVELLALHGQIDRLTAGHAERAARLGQQVDQRRRIAGAAGSAGSRASSWNASGCSASPTSTAVASS